MHTESLAKLLGLLGPSEGEAAIEYRKLHLRLSRFFEWNGCGDPMALADEAIDRLGKRAAEEADKQRVVKPFAFALGIARLLLQEEGRRKQRTIEAIRTWDTKPSDSVSLKEAMSEALERCLAKLQPERRRMLERYYLHTVKEKVQSHQKLADELGLTINALRNRALRARQDLETCIRMRLGENLT